MQAKALYNSLRYNWLEDKSLQVEPWQVEDLRGVAVEGLFARLETLGILLDEKSFSLYAENCSSPEELTECLWVKDDGGPECDQVYLLLFELWRRMLPEKQSLSIFCDEFDHRIDLYDKGLLASDDPIQESLAELETILDENADHGEDPQTVFSIITSYCAHNLETFLYDYILDLIDAENETYASELIEGFCGYVSDPEWFDFLRVLLLSMADPEEGQNMLERFLGEAEEELELD